MKTIASVSFNLFETQQGLCLTKCSIISACNPACNTGLMRCTGTGSDDCCVAFDNGVCSNDLTCTETKVVANEQQNNYTCGKSL